MQRRMVLGVGLFVVLLLVVAAGLSVAEGPGEGAPLEMAGLALGNVEDLIPVQGRLTDAGGTPLNGSYTIVFRLYDASSGGTLVCSDSNSVSVSNGLFTSQIDTCTNIDMDGKQLWVTFQVGADPETARVPIYAVPYARTLRPGAIISNTASSGRGLEVYSRGAESASTTLWAENVGSGGIAVWGIAHGTDASVVSSNKGSGMLFKGFGGDGGEDEFRVNNDGSIESKADSYIFVSGTSFLRDSESDATRLTRRDNGSVQVYSGNAAGALRTIDLPLTLPAVLYGQPVKIKTITVYYVCSSATKGIISSVEVHKQTDADSDVSVISDTTDRTSTTATSFTLTPTSNNVLSSSQGVLNVVLILDFDDDTNYVRVGGVRFQLGHHDLY